MSEKRFLSFVLTEGILLTALSLFMLILPKVSDITFGFTFCLSLIVYGGYKMITSFLLKNFDRVYILNIFNSFLLLASGLMLFAAPMVDMVIIISIIGVYFILQSISSSVFALQVENIFKLWKSVYFISVMQFLFGVLLILLLPTLWAGGILMGLNFLVSGILFLNMYITK